MTDGSRPESPAGGDTATEVHRGHRKGTGNIIVDEPGHCACGRFYYACRGGDCCPFEQTGSSE